MIFVVILVIVALAAVTWWLARQRRPGPVRPSTRGQPAADGRNREARSPPAAPRYDAVEIDARYAACEAAVALRGKRFLAREAPALPLHDCTAAECSCVFVKYADRRADERRLDHAGLGSALHLAKDRRVRHGRREDD
jgi:hypothetical protein